MLADRMYPPPVVPHPLSFPGGGGSLGQPKIFRCGSLCCCVGGCVVGHYHLHPLHSWQDILLTFAEMELDNTTMFPPGTSVMFSLPRAPSPPRPAQSEASSSTRAEQRALVHRRPKRSYSTSSCPHGPFAGGVGWYVTANSSDCGRGCRCGCSGSADVYEGNRDSLEDCQRRCINRGGLVMTYHFETGWCTCRSTCDYSKQLSDYGNPALRDFIVAQYGVYVCVCVYVSTQPAPPLVQCCNVPKPHHTTKNGIHQHTARCLAAVGHESI